MGAEACAAVDHLARRLVITTKVKSLAQTLVAVVAAIGTACSDSIGIQPGPWDRTVTLVGAGDIGECSHSGTEATARLLDGIPGTVFTAGDNVYPDGNARVYRDCYGPTWGRHKTRTRPTPGNHDYDQPGAAPYYEYFGANAGDPGTGYYTYSLGRWRAYALNSELTGSALLQQQEWLKRQLMTDPRCSLAIWHKPLFTSGPNGANAHMRETWRILHAAHVEVVINGHDHIYERFAPQDMNGHPDAHGIRQFIVGTGGAVPYSFGLPRPNSEVLASAWGVLILRLGSATYDWEFVTADGSASNVHDRGSGRCH